ncbi:MAG: lysozyme [Alphaproteobacteria bacterium]|nr:lysozyme [Alphaproteobacteria bacterium]MBV8409123.1 lysozyme [Alphaproteobacteria bacterium]
MTTSDAGIALIQEFEGCVLHAYPDPATGSVPWTIGYGHTHGVQPGDTCDRDQAVAWLREDLQWAEAAVNQYVTVPLAQPQFDALVSFTFNLGSGALAQSTLLRLLNDGTDPAQVSPQFLRWNRGPNGPMPGLTRRRAAEKAMFDGNTIHAVAA